MNVYNYYEETFYTNAFESLYSLIEEIPLSSIHVICIGSDRSTGDCLGPLVGSFIQKNRYKLSVHGTLERPVHALNLLATIKNIYANEFTPFIIAIDACIGTTSKPGVVYITKGPLFPGSSFKKELPAIGDVSIQCIVATSAPNVSSFSLLQSCSLHNTLQYAHTIAHLLLDVEQKLIHKQRLQSEIP